MKCVYIAHPLAGPQSARNVEQYLKWCALAMNQGYAVLSWVVNYLTHARLLTDGDADFYLNMDFVLINVADEVWLCGDWKSSAGGLREKAYAESKKITVIDKGKEIT
jgi:hypothetical protein